MAEEQEFNNPFDPVIPDDLVTQQPDVSWEYLFQPDQWYITPQSVSENFVPLVLSLAAVAVAAFVFWFSRNQGIKTQWYRKLEKGKYYFSETLIFNVWIALYIPLAIGAWLSYVYGGQTWNRALTVYALHLIVNVLFSVSLWWVKDLSLALLNLITLIGVSMFTTSQFNSILKFAGYINTPYMLWLLIFTVQFGYFWYLNEGKELMEAANLARGGAKKAQKKKKGLPGDVKKKLQQQVQDQKASLSSAGESEKEE
ncbi:hypothetical protein FDP41_011222 [Naegleria fowleri]|uniref:Uncharacterized protein n=1 Tax=Naegleria fowleri TaxID=5763 RepID=A0A6A5C640_NAEFO|nr:uncharacterized protein FDP41_011222 [Naegleria fowleri]KAF0982292.1 hypothetical protein FDP41_011222 [Naegleria fowleri]CAG4712132.1 unnamed protein product [Naegleria fowleri]